MIHQTKILKEALRKVGIKKYGKTPSCKNKKRGQEYGYSFAVLEGLSKDDEKKLMDIASFTIIRVGYAKIPFVVIRLGY